MRCLAPKSPRGALVSRKRRGCLQLDSRGWRPSRWDANMKCAMGLHAWKDSGGKDFTITNRLILRLSSLKSMQLVLQTKTRN